MEAGLVNCILMNDFVKVNSIYRENTIYGKI